MILHEGPLACRRQITHSIGRRLRDDHGIAEENIELYKVALTMDQIQHEELRLPRSFIEAKTDSPNYERYFERYRTNDVWELEAVPPRTLQDLLTQHIDAVIDLKAFNRQVARERKESTDNDAVRDKVLRTLRKAVSQ